MTWEGASRQLTVAACIYEVAAITSGRVPTLTELRRRYPVLGVVIMGTLGAHLYGKAAR